MSFINCDDVSNGELSLLTKTILNGKVLISNYLMYNSSVNTMYMYLTYVKSLDFPEEH